MINIREFVNNFPSKTIGREFVTSSNVIEVVKEDGSGVSFNATIQVAGVETTAYLRFDALTKECVTYVVNGVKYI